VSDFHSLKHSLTKGLDTHSIYLHVLLAAKRDAHAVMAVDHAVFLGHPALATSSGEEEDFFFKRRQRPSCQNLAHLHRVHPELGPTLPRLGLLIGPLLLDLDLILIFKLDLMSEKVVGPDLLGRRGQIRADFLVMLPVLFLVLF